MNRDIFEDMQRRLGCYYISDLPDRKREVWEELKMLPLHEYPPHELEDFSRTVFGVRFSILTEVMNRKKGCDVDCKK